MKKVFIALIFLLSQKAFSQNCVHITLIDMAAKKADSVFIAGDFNNWNPGNKKYQLTSKEKGRWEITLLMPAGPQSYKFTQGNWDIAEAKASGIAADNRNFNPDQVILVNDTVAAWTAKASKPREHTASANVHIVDTAFYIPSLQRTRRVWIYLPANYQTGADAYPVLYMHDGQNIFDAFTSGYGEWGVDEALDTLEPQTHKSCIVIAVDHGGDKRMTEYDPYDNARFGKEEGIAYVDFVANTLKPFIDHHYRTQKDAAHTAVAGSSMGGLISAYAILKHPGIFGAAGIFSPSFWITPAFGDLATNSKIENPKLRFWFYAGEKESEHMVPDMLFIKNILSSRYGTDIVSYTDPDASHNETAWRKWFPVFYRWWVAKF